MNIWILNHYATMPDEPATRSCGSRKGAGEECAYNISFPTEEKSRKEIVCYDREDLRIQP